MGLLAVGFMLDIFSFGGEEEQEEDQGETLVGTGGPDILSGGVGDDDLQAGGGADILEGFEGDDYLHGGPGDDLAYGDAGNDYVHGGSGNDIVDGGSGHDVVVGGAGNDVLYGRDGDDHLFGEAGNDVLYGEFGADMLSGGAGDDHIYGTMSSVGPFGEVDQDVGDQLFGNEGDDVIGLGNDDHGTGGQGQDAFFLGTWTQNGHASTVEDYDSAEDVIFVLYDSDEAVAPDVTIQHVGNDSHIFAAGTQIGVVLNAHLAPADVTVQPHDLQPVPLSA